MVSKIKRLYINTVHLVLRGYWFVFRPSGHGVKVLIEYEGKVLLARHNYGHRIWTFPGGGVEKNELPISAAVREMQEEVGISLSEVAWFGLYETDYEYKKVIVDCYYATVLSSAYKIDNFELAEAQWFPLNDLPKDRVLSVDKIIKLYKAKVYE